jgi:hypothetical protein
MGWRSILTRCQSATNARRATSRVNSQSRLIKPNQAFCDCRHARAKLLSGVNLKRVLSLTKTIFAIFTAFAVSSGNTSAAPGRQLSGHVPGVVAKLKASSRLSGETRLNLAIGLPLRNQEALNALMQALYDPSSPQYRHYLTPDQFTEQFGPTVEDYQAVVNFAAANGFTVTATHSDRMLLEVSAAATDVERAFQVTMNLYPHPSEKRAFFSPNVEPSVPADLPIADISGLNNYSHPHPKIMKKKSHGPSANGPISNGSGPAAKNVSQEGTGPNGNFVGSDFRAAYVPGVTNTGTGQIVGLLEFDGYFPSDIASYASQAGIADPPPVKNVLVAGFNGLPGDGNSEVALDLEMVMAMAPGLTDLACFETSTNTTANVILAAMATNTTINQFSCSWDFGTGNARSTMDSYFQKFITQGQSFFDASGDFGAYTGAIPEPDDDPYVTLVGGTTLTTSSPGGAWMGEVAWNAPDYLDSSGGGISTTYALPSWQTGVKTNSNGASTTSRNVPDVALAADNIYIVYDGGETSSTGGTSCSVQLWAGLMALINQQSQAAGHAPLGFLNPDIYPLYKSRAYLATFDDITVGNSDDTNYNPVFFATPDYDLCTGIGSPAGGSLILALASPDGLLVTPARGFTANGPAGGPFNITSQVLSLTNTNSASLAWALGGVPAWLNVSAKSGTLTAGNGGTNVTVSLNSIAATAVAGVYTANLWLTNIASGQAQIRQVTLQVDQNLIHDGGFESGDFAYWTLTGLDAGGFNFVDNGSYTPYTAYDGNYYAALGEATNNILADLSETLQTTPGQLYQISFYLNNDTEDLPPIQLAVQWNTAKSTNTLYSTNNLPDFLDSSGWQNIQLFAVATTNTTFLQFASLDYADWMAIDDVTVFPVSVPTIQSVRQSTTTVQHTWSATPGLVYQIQSTPTLSPTQWTNLGPPITAVGASVTAAETIGSGKAQFFRVVLELP